MNSLNQLLTSLFVGGKKDRVHFNLPSVKRYYIYLPHMMERELNENMCEKCQTLLGPVCTQSMITVSITLIS